MTETRSVPHSTDCQHERVVVEGGSIMVCETQSPPPPHWLDFGAELRDARRAAGLTQRQLADRAGIDHTYISRLEHGRNQPPATDTITALASAVGVDREQFYRHIWKGSLESMSRSALEQYCVCLLDALDAATRVVTAAHALTAEPFWQFWQEAPEADIRELHDKPFAEFMLAMIAYLAATPPVPSGAGGEGGAT